MSPIAARARAASLQLPGVRFGGLAAEPVRRLPTGIGRLDALLDGGLPHGHLSEIVGGPSSGRTALLQALLASATQRGEVTAVIDLPDTLDPPSLARAGVDLERVLWVRPPADRMSSIWAWSGRRNAESGTMGARRFACRVPLRCRTRRGCGSPRRPAAPPQWSSSACPVG